MLNRTQKQQSVFAISETLSLIHGDPPLAADEIESLTEKQLDLIAADFSEAVLGMNDSEMTLLNTKLQERGGLTVGEFFQSSKSFISKIARKKVWSSDDLVVLSAVYDQLNEHDQKRFNEAVKL